MASNPPRPTDAELEILSVLRETGPCTVREVFEVLLKRRTAQYSTVLEFLQIMAEKGLVRRDESQRAHVYEAARPVSGRSSNCSATCWSERSQDPQKRW